MLSLRPLHLRTLLVLVGACLVVLPLAWAEPASAPKPAQSEKVAIDFSRQIRPILSDACFTCHGPDDQQRKAKFRLDTKEGLFAKLRGGGHAVVPGETDTSVLIERITAADPADRMPPARSNKKLKPQQIELLKQWVEQGAPWSEHWAFVPPARSDVPKVTGSTWARNAIDHFILAKLDKLGLKPSPEADRTTLIRRLTLDLMGLPPTPLEVDAFLADTRPDAYERLVDRLLASPHYGERLAVDWLDAARFADTHGYHIDAGRDMSRWREWVIDAFNSDLPFDQFTVEQLAGDLLPPPAPPSQGGEWKALSQKIASGFNRNHMINFEGGAIPEEYHNAYIVDRVNTTATVWLGLTVACAQCHDHKYDPISQKEYYQLYAFFHNVPESGLDGARGNAAPLLKAPSKAQQQQLAKLDAELKDLHAKLIGPMPNVDEKQLAWEKMSLVQQPAKWQPFDPLTYTSQEGAKLTKLGDLSILASGPNPATETYTLSGLVALPKITAIRLEALPHDSFVAKGPGRSDNGNIVLTNVRLFAVTDKTETPLTVGRASADFSQTGYPVEHAIDDDPKTGWAIHPEVGKAHSAVFELKEPLVNPGMQSIKVVLDFQSGIGRHQLGHFRLALTDAREPHSTASMPSNITAILNTPAEKRTDAHKSELRDYYRSKVSRELNGLRDEMAKVQKSRTELEKQIPDSMVMQEVPKLRATHILMRGEYDKKGEKVESGVPSALPSLVKDAPVNRLGLARWLVDSRQPLTSRVIVNRYWQMIFGVGLVKTAEDFGAQGEPSSHPELLDWLAVELMQPSSAPLKKAWSVKELLRLFVTSSTYRQSAKVTPELHARDPENRYLARGPRYRLQAEFIRDQALAISGLLNREIGGKSVSPYQPKGLWSELSIREDSKNWSAQFFVQSKGHDLYRRSMYTFWKRTSPPPQMLTFDAPDRETCTVRRGRTNTPLQALILMNDPTYVEASRKLAERLLREGKTTDERLTLAFRLATSRPPSEKELTILRGVLDRQLDKYSKDEKAALKLLAVGESARDERLPVAELAAWTIVANVILNLDETVTKN